MNRLTFRIHILLIFCALSVKAQFVPFYEERTTTVFGDSRLFDFLQLPNGDILYAGERSNDCWLLKTGADGHIIWSKTYTTTAPGAGSYGSASARKILKLDNGYFIAGEIFFSSRRTDLTLFKVDTAGNPVWQKIYGSSNFEASKHILFTNDGHVVFAGIQHAFAAPQDTALMAKADTSGNMIWMKRYAFGTVNDIINDITECTDGNYAITGETTNYNTPNHFAFLHDWLAVKFDTSGNVMWANMLRSSTDTVFTTAAGMHIITRADNGLDMVGGWHSGNLLSLSAGGHFIRVRRYLANPMISEVTMQTLTRAPDGSLYVAGISGNPTNKSFVMNIDSTGNFNYGRSYASSHRYSNLQIKLDSTLQLAGYDTIAGKIYGLMMHLDQYARTGCEGVAGMQIDTFLWHDSLHYIQQVYPFNTINATMTLHPDSENVSIYCTTAGIQEQLRPEQIKIFPQPMSDQCQIELPEYFENVRAELIDVTGRIIDRQQLGNGTRFTLQRKNWPAGLYGCTLYSGNQRLGSVKLMVRE